MYKYNNGPTKKSAKAGRQILKLINNLSNKRKLIIDFGFSAKSQPTLLSYYYWDYNALGARLTREKKWRLARKESMA